MLEVMLCTVATVLDGDTLICKEADTRVRLACIDAPEKSQGKHGTNATAYLHHLKGMVVELRISTTDKYGRKIAEVFFNKENIGLSSVAQGLSVVYPRYCKEERYFNAEATARQSKKGVWSEEGLHQTPWVYRHQ
jgi:endonuclease YncB( thermonuclease family)